MQVLHFSLSKVLGILIYEKIETSGVPFHAAVVFSLGPDFIQVLAGFFWKYLRDFFLNLQGGLSSGYPDQILNELNILDSYPAENRYI